MDKHEKTAAGVEIPDTVTEIDNRLRQSVSPRAIRGALIRVGLILGGAEDWDADTLEGVLGEVDPVFHAAGLPSMAETDVWQDLAEQEGLA